MVSSVGMLDWRADEEERTNGRGGRSDPRGDKN